MDDNAGLGESLPAEITQQCVEHCMPSKDHKTLAAECRSWYEAADKQRGPAAWHQEKCERLCACITIMEREACQSRQSQPLQALPCPTSHLSTSESGADTVLHTSTVLSTQYHFTAVTQRELCGATHAQHPETQPASNNNYSLSLSHTHTYTLIVTWPRPLQGQALSSRLCPSILEPRTTSAVQHLPHSLRRKAYSKAKGYIDKQRRWAHMGVFVCVCVTRGQGHP